MSPQPQVAVGAPLSRVDGRLKVTGQAKYAADHEPGGPEGVVHAVVVDSSIARGRITGIDTGAAEAQPGVLKVLHHRNAPRLPYGPNPGSLNLPGERLRVFQDDQVRFHGQPVAVVVATTLEAAQHAASLVEIDYAVEPSATDLSEAPATGEPVTYTRGDAEAALQSAAVRLEMTYRPARNHHNAMELHATVAQWDGDRLTLWDKTQWVQSPRAEVAANFGIPAESIRVTSPLRGRRVRKRGPGLAAHHHRGPRRPRGGPPGQARTDTQAALLRGRIPADVRVQGAPGQRPVAGVVATWVVADETALADGLATALFFTDASRLAETFQFTCVRMHAGGRIDCSPDFAGELFA